MAPGNNERHPSHTGTIPKTKARNNCNVPQEAVTPTRRDMASNLVTTSLDWVPVSEYNTRTNYSQSRKQTNNTSDQELTDLDNSVSFESGFGRFVPVRPQPRALPLNVQNRENLTNDQHDDVAGSSMTGHSLHLYAHQMQNGLVPHSNHVNHAAAAVMIVNPTTPNALTANMSQPFNAPNHNRKNLTNNLNPARNNFDGNHTSNNNATIPVSNSRSGTKTVNLMNNMYDQGQGSLNNLNENNHVHRESARALGDAIVAACPDTAAVERRLGQIREYIRVTSSLVDTMRNSEDEAFIEHTKEEYDELVEMVMKLKESETKLKKVLTEVPDNVEVPAEEADGAAQTTLGEPPGDTTGIVPEININENETCSEKSIIDAGVSCTNNLKKVTNLENEQLNKSLHCAKNSHEALASQDASDSGEATSDSAQPILELICNKRKPDENDTLEIVEIESIPYGDNESKTHDRQLNEVLRKNIISCVEKVALIEEMKNKNCNSSNIEDQEIVIRPVSVQSNGSAYSENELWQSEIKNKMELSQRRLTALKQQQKRLLKYQEEAKQQLEEINRERQSQEALPSTSHDNFGGMQSHPMNGNHNHRMYAANQIGVATTLPQSTEALLAPNTSSNANSEHGHSAHSNSQDDRFSHRDANIASSEEAGGGARDSDAEEDAALLSERGRMLQAKLRELQLKKQHMENLVSEFQKLQMATHLGSSNNTYSSSGEDSGDEEPSRKCNKSGGNIKNEDPFKLMEIKAIKTALQKTKDLMRSVENYESDHLSGTHDDSFQMPSHSNINDNKSEGGGSIGGWSNEGSVCRVRNSLPQRHKFTNEQHSQQHMQQSQQHMQQHMQPHPQHSQQHPQHPQQHPQHSQQHPQHPQKHPQHSQQHPQQHSQQHMQQMSHETNIASLQELAQELRMETEKIFGERARIKGLISNKESSRKQKKVNEQPPGGGGGGGGWGCAGPAERRQLQLRALLADKQRELDKLLNKVNEQPPGGGGGGGGWGCAGPAERRQLQLRALLADKQRELDKLLNKVNEQPPGGGGGGGGWGCAGPAERRQLQLRALLADKQRELDKLLNKVNEQPPGGGGGGGGWGCAGPAERRQLQLRALLADKQRELDKLLNKVNEQPPGGGGGGGGWGCAGPAERRQLQLRALLADKQRELDKLLNKEKVLCASVEAQDVTADSRTASVVNQSYNSEQEEPDSRSEQILLDSQNSRDTDNFRACPQGGDSALGARSVNTIPSQLGSAYCSDSDSASRTKSNQRSRARRRQPQDRLSEDNNMPQSNNSSHSLRHEPRVEPSNVNMVPPISQNIENPINMPYPHLPPPYWNNNKINQDMRTNQFTQNSHSQTMERLLGTPQMAFPPSMPINMMMPYGVVGGCGCGCGLWGAWCWQQLAVQQREIHQLRDQLTHLEERWRAETASHTLNNQVPPGNRANNYWDNFRSYSRQNLLSANSKTNADGHLGPGGAAPHPLASRAHNALRRAAPAPAPAPAPPPPKRNTSPRRRPCERSLSFSSAPDVLNVNVESPAPGDAAPAPTLPRPDAAFRNLNIADPIPEIIQAHSNNLNAPTDAKRKSSSKLPAKNSTGRRNFALDYAQTSNIDIAGTSQAPNPNLASASREVRDKAASKLFDLLRENVYSEVTTLIGVNESHPDFLIQLFKELQLISSDPLRQRVLQSIRNVLTQYDTMLDGQTNDFPQDERPDAAVTTTSGDREPAPPAPSACSSTMQYENGIVRLLCQKSHEMCTTELLETVAVQVMNGGLDGRPIQISKKRLFDFLSKYEGMRVCDVSNDIIESLPLIVSGVNDGDESAQLASELSESSILQDVAGSLNLFSSSDSQLHQLNACPYDMWPAHVHMDIDGSDLNENGSPRSSQDGKVDLINCSEMLNGDLAEADQTCRAEAARDDRGPDALPDVVDTDEATPTEAEAEWLGLDRVPTRLHMGESSERQKD